MDERDWVAPEGKDSGELGVLSVDVIGMVTDVMLSSGKGVRDGMFGRCGMIAVVI